MTTALTRATVVSTVCVRLTVETSASKATDMVGKWQFLVDDDAEVNDRTKQLNLWTSWITFTTDISTLASWCRVPRQVHETVLPEFNLSIGGHRKTNVQDCRRTKIPKHSRRQIHHRAVYDLPAVQTMPRHDWKSFFICRTCVTGQSILPSSLASVMDASSLNILHVNSKHYVITRAGFLSSVHTLAMFRWLSGIPRTTVPN